MNKLLTLASVSFAMAALLISSCVPIQPDAADPASESKYYSPRAQLEVFVVPGSGHNINLHYSAP